MKAARAPTRRKMCSSAFLNSLQRGTLRRAPPFHRGADDATGIGDEIGDDEHPTLMQETLGIRCAGDIGPLDHQPRLQLIDVAPIDDVRTGRRDPDIAGQTDHGVPMQRLAVRIIRDAGARFLQCPEGRNVESFGVVYGAARIRCADQSGAALAEEVRRVPADGTEALDDDACAFEGDTGHGRGQLGCGQKPPASGANLIEGNAADLPRQSDNPADLVSDPGHALFVRTHVRRKDVVVLVAQSLRQAANQDLLVRGIHPRIGEQHGLSPTMRQARGSVLEGHRPGEADTLLDTDVFGHAHATDRWAAGDVVNDENGPQFDRRLVNMHDLARAKRVRENETVLHPGSLAATANAQPTRKHRSPCWSRACKFHGSLTASPERSRQHALGQESGGQMRSVA